MISNTRWAVDVAEGRLARCIACAGSEVHVLRSLQIAVRCKIHGNSKNIVWFVAVFGGIVRFGISWHYWFRI